MRTWYHSSLTMHTNNVPYESFHQPCSSDIWALTHFETRTAFSRRLAITVEAIEQRVMSWKGWAQSDASDIREKVNDNPANENRMWLAGIRMNVTAWRGWKAKELWADPWEGQKTWTITYDGIPTLLTELIDSCFDPRAPEFVYIATTSTKPMRWVWSNTECVWTIPHQQNSPPLYRAWTELYRVPDSTERFPLIQRFTELYN